MQAIKTKTYVDKNGNTKIAVSCQAGRKSYQKSQFEKITDREEKSIHVAACKEFREWLVEKEFKELGHPKKGNAWLKPMICGALNDCYVHVFFERV